MDWQLKRTNWDTNQIHYYDALFFSKILKNPFLNPEIFMEYTLETICIIGPKIKAIGLKLTVVRSSTSHLTHPC